MSNIREIPGEKRRVYMCGMRLCVALDSDLLLDQSQNNLTLYQTAGERFVDSPAGY